MEARRAAGASPQRTIPMPPQMPPIADPTRGSAQRADLLAGAVHAPAQVSRAPTILVFDSGLGGLSVHEPIAKARPDARIIYLADDAAFPYGRWRESDLVQRVTSVIGRAIGLYRPDIVVVACSTASTLVLPHLRRTWALPFVGTVPAIKPAAIASVTKRISVLATPGTVARDYTRDLISAYAYDCEVRLVGARRLAELAEAELRGDSVSDADLLAEIEPAFSMDPGGRTDTIVLACTHYPLLRRRFDAIAPWPVAWIDPGPAIARRVSELMGKPLFEHEPGEAEANLAVFTSGAHVSDRMREVLASRGFAQVVVEPMPVG
jgi:glutamate racemase